MRTSLLLALAAAAPLSAQRGDKAGEDQPPLPDDLVVPPAPALSPEEQLETFALPPGYRIELVAAEPLVHDPVQAFFDWDGSLWVCEMRGFMPDVDGEGEDAPVGSIARLVDEDGDGRMDRREVFLDELVLPRAIAPYQDGLLYIAPPDLLFVQDTDGDGHWDDREVVDTGFGGVHSPEHAPNGLMLGVDGWIELANHARRYRRVDGVWEWQRTAGGGQWGISKDDLGRRFFDTNSDGLRGDLVSSHYAVRNPNTDARWGVNVRIAHDQTVWPARITPGVNRGYRKGTLRDDWTLARFTGACGPHVYRGDALPADARGDAFVCEPCGNLVKRFSLEEDERGQLRATNAYEGREFLTSTDERFRPVNLFDGPDGALYVVDMYRGVIQHRIFVTSWLREQVVARDLETPIGLGRIWRVVHEEVEPAGSMDLELASSRDLIDFLGHPNGWQRDTAQRLLAWEGVWPRRSTALSVQTMSGRTPIARMHGLWTLAQVGWLTRQELGAGITDPDWRVRHAAVRVGETTLAAGGDDADWLRETLLARLPTEDRAVRRQIRLSLGELPTADRPAALARALTIDASSQDARAAILSGANAVEADVLALLLVDPEWEFEEEGRSRAVEQLARAVAVEGRTDRLATLFEALAEDPVEWRRAALVKGALAGRPTGPKGEPTYLPISRRPDSFDALAGTGVEDWLLWPGREDVEVEVVRPLTADEQRRFDAGSVLFAETCVQCHQRSGLGEPGKAPPLRHSEWVLGDDARLVRVVTGGLTGPIRVRGQHWSGDMPAWSGTDAEAAALLTYLRREWGHGAEPVTSVRVAEVRAATDRAEPWTAEALEAIE